MNTPIWYWYFDKALTPRFCDEVIKYGLSQEASIARTGDFNNVKLDKNQIKDLKRKRNSDLVWMERNTSLCSHGKSKFWLEF